MFKTTQTQQIFGGPETQFINEMIHEQKRPSMIPANFQIRLIHNIP